MLLEKAWAKVNGGYQNIEMGWTREALHDITGAPTKTYFRCDGAPQERWNIMWDAFQNNFIVAASTRDLNGNGMDSIDGFTGLAGNHAYSLLNAFTIVEDGLAKWHIKQAGEIVDPKKKVERLVKLRNPWGKGEWRHAWADGSMEWDQMYFLIIQNK